MSYLIARCRTRNDLAYADRQSESPVALPQLSARVKLIPRISGGLPAGDAQAPDAEPEDDLLAVSRFIYDNCQDAARKLRQVTARSSLAYANSASAAESAIGALNATLLDGEFH